MRYAKVVMLAVIITTLGCSGLRVTASSLPVPNPKYLSIKDPATVIVRWDPIVINEDNAVQGIRVKLWAQKNKVYDNVELNGETISFSDLSPVENLGRPVSTNPPTYETVVPPDATTATFDVQVGVHYEIRAQAYNANGDGPLSSSVGIKIHDDKKTYSTTSAPTNAISN